MLSQSAELIPIDQILVDREHRQRKRLDTQSLEDSIRRIGLLHPITVRRRGSTEDLMFPYQLMTGERRLTACKNLGEQQILARFFDQLDPIQAQIVELEENIKREDLDWKEIVESVARIHGLYGAAEPDWTMTATADQLGLGKSAVSMYLRVWGDWSDTRVQQAQTVREAYNILARRDQRAQGDALAELMEVDPVDLPGDMQEAMLEAPADEENKDAASPSHNHGSNTDPVGSSPDDNGSGRLSPKAAAPSIANESFLDWAPKYKGPKFSLVHCDFPYGVNLFDGKQGRGLEPGAGYADTPEIYFALLECFCTHLDRFMSGSAHLLFWCSADTQRVAQTLDTFARLAPSLEFAKFPLIWFKTDNAGISSDPRRTYRHVYEHCLFASRSKRHLLGVTSDCYGAPTNRSLHASTKPEPMLKHFMSVLVDQETSCFDPTAGSGSSLLAAEALGARRVFGLEIDEDHCRRANQALAHARGLREVSRKVG